MHMDRPKIKRSEALLLLAKASFGDKRRRSPLRIVIAICIFLIPIALFTLWIWPKAKLPPMLLAAYDQIALPGETVTLTAQIEPAEAAQEAPSLTGRTLFFQEPRSEFLTQALTNDFRGEATAQTVFPAFRSPVEFIVRYRDEDPKHAAQATGRVFLWPADSSILVVNVETLTEWRPDSLWNFVNLDVNPRAGSVQALQKASSKFRIIYISTEADRPSRYNKLRAWLEHGWVPAKERFPEGPVLAVLRSKEREMVTNLKQRFFGKAIGINVLPVELEGYVLLPPHTKLKGTGQFPFEVMASSWKELDEKLSK
jgi:hypothetical protein